MDKAGQIIVGAFLAPLAGALIVAGVQIIAILASGHPIGG